MDTRRRRSMATMIVIAAILAIASDSSRSIYSNSNCEITLCNGANLKAFMMMSFLPVLMPKALTYEQSRDLGPRPFVLMVLV